MKKTIAVLLALILAFSAFGITTFAAGETKTDALFDKMEQSKEVTVSFRPGSLPEYGHAFDVTNTVYIKGDQVAYDIDNGFIHLRTVARDGSLVSFMPSFPFLHMKATNLSFIGVDLWSIINGLSNFTMEFLVFVKSYETTIDGVTYYVEDFSDRGTVINSFYYVGDELKMLRVEDFAIKAVQYTYFDEIRFSADDDVFELPLISFDVTPLFKIFLAWLMTPQPQA